MTVRRLLGIAVLACLVGGCSSSSSRASTAVAGHASPSGVATLFIRGLLAGENSVVCGAITPSEEQSCRQSTNRNNVFSGYSGHLTVNQVSTSGDRALVAVTGSVCQPGTGPGRCLSNSADGAGLPSSPSLFDYTYDHPVVTLRGEMWLVIPCFESSGSWYVDMDGFFTG
jgi:hypothetical protein